MKKAHLLEVLSTVQGEGIYAGVRQVFLRFHGCNLRCRYCDTQEALSSPPSTCRVEKEAGRREFFHLPNPLSVNKVIQVVSSLLEVPHHSLSLTGGEPLLHVEFLKAFLPCMKRLDTLIYLDTNGILASNLKEVLSYIDIISMDVKLDSVAGCGERIEQHLEFLKIALEKEVFLKVVLTSETDSAELKKSLELLSIKREIPVVLQPVSPIFNLSPPSAKRLLYYQQLALSYFNDVRNYPFMKHLYA